MNSLQKPSSYVQELRALRDKVTYRRNKDTEALINKFLFHICPLFNKTALKGGDAIRFECWPFTFARKVAKAMSAVEMGEYRDGFGIRVILQEDYWPGDHTMSLLVTWREENKDE